jgi:putative transcriptional regulator
MDDPTATTGPISYQGKLLLADPSLRGTSFHRSVILLAEHSVQQGTLGMILNHPTGEVVGNFLSTAEFLPLSRLAVFHGGPVATDQLTFSSFWWDPKKGLRWALRISVKVATAHSQKPGRIVRAFVGHSGWSGGQLENELRGASWLTAQPQPDLLGRVHDRSLWSELIGEVSPLHRILALAPDEPLFN